MKLEGKIAAITGGTAGLGRGIAEAFLAEGASVALMARNTEKGQRVLDELGVGDRAIFIAGDAMEQGDIEGFIDQTVTHFGAIDILVNNAGGAGDLQPMVNLSDEAFDQAMKWNVYSTFWATRRALRPMLERKSGRIINISSMEGKHGKPIFTAYTAAKHAINGMTKSLAREVGADGITVNAICPGMVITDIIRENGPLVAKTMGMELDEMINLFAQESAIKRPNTVEEVAAVALLLASHEGGGITGAMISVDGGTAQY
ncbi:SDR family NAD(P)-dependent oxidoreductase [Aquisediminimonas profunda]|uniref:SDR family NAD(P)-dependent oxidoreductase n=1 Tax=Aquisediminimonas profunda TaxID=1550733 RepID=UPI001C62C5F8|nr:SDR family NAD(P)-dependent oxidoreductase [Aquisediminimonas profunda]